MKSQTELNKIIVELQTIAPSSDIIARSETFDKNLCSSEETAECMLILTQLIMRSTISESNMLSFQSEKVRDLFLKNFRNLIEKVKDFI